MVTPEQLLDPVGEIDASIMFPDVDPALIERKIQGFIDDGMTRSSDDAVVRAWAYYRAFNAVHLRMAAQPTRAELPEGGSYSYLLTQINVMRDRAAEYLAEYNTLIENAVVTRTYPATTSVLNEFVF